MDWQALPLAYPIADWQALTLAYPIVGQQVNIALPLAYPIVDWQSLPWHTLLWIGNLSPGIPYYGSAISPLAYPIVHRHVNLH